LIQIILHLIKMNSETYDGYQFSTVTIVILFQPIYNALTDWNIPVSVKWKAYQAAARFSEFFPEEFTKCAVDLLPDLNDFFCRELVRYNTNTKIVQTIESFLLKLIEDGDQPRISKFASEMMLPLMRYWKHYTCKTSCTHALHYLGGLLKKIDNEARLQCQAKFVPLLVTSLTPNGCKSIFQTLGLHQLVAKLVYSCSETLDPGLVEVLPLILSADDQHSLAGQIMCLTSYVKAFNDNKEPFHDWHASEYPSVQGIKQNFIDHTGVWVKSLFQSKHCFIDWIMGPCGKLMYHTLRSKELTEDKKMELVQLALSYIISAEKKNGYSTVPAFKMLLAFAQLIIEDPLKTIELIEKSGKLSFVDLLEYWILCFKERTVPSGLSFHSKKVAVVSLCKLLTEGYLLKFNLRNKDKKNFNLEILEVLIGVYVAKLKGEEWLKCPEDNGEEEESSSEKFAAKSLLEHLSIGLKRLYTEYGDLFMELKEQLSPELNSCLENAWSKMASN